jgi:hypothetical protein
MHRNPLVHSRRITTLDNLRHGILLELIRMSNPFAHIRLSLVPKLPSKASTNLEHLKSHYDLSSTL